MNRAQRRADKYRKPRVDRNARTLEQRTAWAKLIEDVRPYDAGEMTENFVQIRCAFERLRTGVGSLTDFDLVGKHLNMGMLRAEEISPVLKEIMVLGQQAFVRMQARVRRGLTLGFDADGLRDVPEAIDAFEAITEASSPRQMTIAINKMFERIRAGHVLGVLE